MTRGSNPRRLNVFYANVVEMEYTLDLGSSAHYDEIEGSTPSVGIVKIICEIGGIGRRAVLRRLFP